MARGTFSTANYLSRTDVVGFTGYPITMAVWLYAISSPVEEYVFTFGKSTDPGTEQHVLVYLASALRFAIRNAAEEVALSAGGPTTSAWNHACYVGAANNDHRFYRDGGNKQTSATTVTWPSVDRLHLGAWLRKGAFQEVGLTSGYLAEAAIWNAALDDAEVAALGKGFSPLLIRPPSLVAYWDLIRDLRDRWKTKYNLTETGTVSVQPHCRVLAPSSRRG